ncbi:MAG: DUF6702 family protein [Ginsengibacter sp.]
MNIIYLLTLFLIFPFNNAIVNDFSAKKDGDDLHPFYVSVTEIKENSKDKILEISCKIFTDDFEKTLRMHYPDKIDLLNPPDRTVANKLIKDYITKHLSIIIDGKKQVPEYVGYEKNEEGIESYFQVKNPVIQSRITVINNLLFEYKPEQINIVHVTVRGKRQSTQLANPDESKTFNF